jgi:RimJ/RimL family protein N-acetyltransferase
VAEDRVTGKPIGSMGPWFPGDWPEEELGWTIWTEEAEGKGYAFEAVTALRRHAYEALGWRTAVSYIDPSNTRSRALALAGSVARSTRRHQPPVRDNEIEVWRHPAPEEIAA